MGRCQRKRASTFGNAVSKTPSVVMTAPEERGHAGVPALRDR
ncbi:hypothetical protein [Nonomuraea sp. NPDC050540]